MDPISAIVAALAAGAAAALKDTASEAVKDAYGALKSLIGSRFGSVDVEQLEKNPESAGRQATVKEELQATDAARSTELLAAAQDLLERIESLGPQQAAATGVDLEKIKAANVAIRDIAASGSGVIARDVEASGDLTIENVRAGSAEPPKKA
jgi:hypothetical protein